MEFSPLSPPLKFLTTYDAKTGIEMFEREQRWNLKLVAKLMNVWILPVLSPRCFHQWGGAKMMLRELQSWITPDSFVFKTDVYSYYASLNHVILFQQLKAIEWPERLMETVLGYCQRTILRIGPSLHCTRGIPKGGAVSPVLGALYLTPLDHAMERQVKRGDCFYARFQDDIILVARKRHVLRRMRLKMYKVLNALMLTLRSEKTYLGRSHKGFDLLGYHISPDGLSPSLQTQEKAIVKAKRRYAQGGGKSLHSYLNRWRTWVHAGLPFKVHHVDDVIESIIALFDIPRDKNLETEPCRKLLGSVVDSLSKYPARLSLPICSEFDGANNREGKLICKNFSEHSRYRS